MLATSSDDHETMVGTIFSGRGGRPAPDRTPGRWSLPTVFSLAECLKDLSEAGIVGRLDAFSGGMDESTSESTGAEPRAETRGWLDLDQAAESLEVRVDELTALLLWPLLSITQELVNASPGAHGRGAGGHGLRLPYRVVSRDLSDSWSVGLRPLWALRTLFGCPPDSRPEVFLPGTFSCLVGPRPVLDLVIAEKAMEWHTEGRLICRVPVESDQVSLAEEILRYLSASCASRRYGIRVVAGGRPQRSGGETFPGPEAGRHGTVESIRSQVGIWFESMSTESKTVLLVNCVEPLEDRDWELLCWLEDALPQRLEIVVACADGSSSTVGAVERGAMSSSV